MLRMALARGAICLHVALFLGAVAGSNPVPSDKAETWAEVTTPHFTVMSDDGEKTARRVADQFEQIRRLYSKSLNSMLRVDPGIPILVIAVRNEKLLSEVIPEYWARKENVHPAGLFVPGQEKNYIVLRTDVGGSVPYLPIYHEYVHLIINLNFQQLPLWLNEGFADFLGNATLLPNGGTFGQFNSSYLKFLSETQLLPFEVLFGVDHRSSYYNEATKANIFYAESWALVHYMMTDSSQRRQKLLSHYIRLVENGDDPLDAAKAAFGNLAQLREGLESYVRRAQASAYAISLSPDQDSANYQVRNLSTAAAEARLGDFDLYRGQLEAARSKLEDAIRLDPSLAVAQESMGLLLFRQEKPYQAQAYFSRALTLNSNSALANFFDGMLLFSIEDDDKNLLAAQQLLEKAVALNPLLAPAWDSLGMLYSRDPATLDKALSAVQNAGYQLDAASILMAMRRFDDARAIATSVEKSAPADVSARAERLRYQIDQANDVASSPDPYHGQGIDPFARSAGSDRDALPNVDSSRPVLKRRRIGTIEAVDCTNDPAVTMTFRETASVTHVHLASLSMIDIHVGSSKPSAGKLTCDELNKKRAIILYQPVPDKAWDGEILIIELVEAP